MQNEDWAQWRQARLAELAGPESWLGWSGLFWLEPGANTLGSDPACTLCLPGGPAQWGTVYWEAGGVRWQPRRGPAQMLASDLQGVPTTVDHENWTFFIVDREQRLGLRLINRAWAAQRPFAGLTCYPESAAWRIQARWRQLPTPVAMAVHNVSGELKTVEIAWQAEFTWAGQPVTLLPISVSDEAVFFVFRDRTSGRETYGAGRFLKLPRPAGEIIELDFNRAYNPPCAFTAFATCPLPPPENWLPFAVTAGEQKYIAS